MVAVSWDSGLPVLGGICPKPQWQSKGHTPSSQQRGNQPCFLPSLLWRAPRQLFCSLNLVWGYEGWVCWGQLSSIVWLWKGPGCCFVWFGSRGMVGTKNTQDLAAAGMGLNFTCNSSILWPWASTKFSETQFPQPLLRSLFLDAQVSESSWVP